MIWRGNIRRSCRARACRAKPNDGVWTIGMITNLEVPSGSPSEKQLADLQARFGASLALLKAEDSEVRLPLIVEFSGSPKSGKSSVINILTHLFKRLGAEVAAPAEGASLMHGCAARILSFCLPQITRHHWRASASQSLSTRQDR